MAEASKSTGTEDDKTPLEEMMAVYGDELRQQDLAARWRARYAAAAHTERTDRRMAIRQLQAEQVRRDTLGVGTAPQEALDSWNAEWCRDFIEALAKAKERDGKDPFEVATSLPIDRDGDKGTIRGFLIGCAGDRPNDSGWMQDASGLYICEDGTLRTYRADRETGPALRSLPITTDGNYQDIYPGHFTEGTVGQRRHASLTKGLKAGELPPGVEAVGQKYMSSGRSYQTHQVHMFREEALPDVLAATAHFAIIEDAPRPMYNPFDPAKAPSAE